MSGFTRTAIVSRSPTVFVGPGDFTFAGQNMVLVKKTIAGPTTVIMSNPMLNCEYVITDGKGDAGANPITIQGNGSLINGGASFVINTNRGSVTLFFDGAAFHVIGERP